MIPLAMTAEFQEVLKAGQAFLAFYDDLADGPLFHSGAH